MWTKISRLPTLAVLGMALAIWIFGLLIAQVSSIGYFLFTIWEIVAPTLITIFLYARAVNREISRRVRWRLRVAWLATLVVVLQLGVIAWQRHQAADDVADIWWTIYQFCALIFGTACFWITYGVAYPFTREPKLNANQGRLATASPPPAT